MKKAIFLVVLLFLIIGVVSASENINITNTDNSVSVSDNETIEVENTKNNTLNHTNYIELKSNSSIEIPSITTNDIKGTEGKEIILNAIVKNSTGAISDVNVTFKLNGVTYTSISDNDGVASVVVKCPKSEETNFAIKYNSKILTHTTDYFKEYSATASINGASSKFKVISTNKIVNTYKVTKKKSKIITLKVKKGTKFYKKGNYAFGTYKYSKGKYNYLEITGVGKYEGEAIAFSMKEHFKKDGKWQWSSWVKIKKGEYNECKFLKNMAMDKIKIKYTQTTYKKI